MSDFRYSQNQAHPNKTNTLMTAIVVVLMMTVSIQIWLLYSALNNALDDNFNIAVAAFGASFGLFLLSAWLLRYLPFPRKKIPQNKS